MKLYLSSYRVPVPEALTGLLPKPPAETRLAIIPNAKDYYAERARNFKIEDVTTYFENLGFKPDVFDLLDFNDASAVAAKLKDYELLWVSGGNTFNLRFEMQRSGFDQVIKEAVEAGLVYAGDSAGAIIAGPTLEGVGWADEPAFAEKAIEEGLRIVPQIVIPHADSHEYGEVTAKIAELHKDKPDVVVLNDNQALVIDGDRHEIVTAPA